MHKKKLEIKKRRCRQLRDQLQTSHGCTFLCLCSPSHTEQLLPDEDTPKINTNPSILTQATTFLSSTSYCIVCIPVLLSNTHLIKYIYPTILFLHRNQYPNTHTQLWQHKFSLTLLTCLFWLVWLFLHTAVLLQVQQEHSSHCECRCTGTSS